MKIFTRLLATFAGAVACAALATPASAQATRTWVSGVGDDANPCSRTAPCKTFPGAISKTATGGEINCLDPAGFGGVTITKSISIVCDHTEGGVLSAGAGVNGIIVNTPASSIVFLSGLELNGAGSAQNGLRVVSGGKVHLQNSVIRNYRATNGNGISYQPSGAGVLTVTNVTIADNGNGATGGGILIQPTGASGTSRVFHDTVRLINNDNAGIRMETTGQTSGSGNILHVSNSAFTGSANGLTQNTPIGTSFAIANVTGSQFTNLFGNVLSVNGASSTIRISESMITASGNPTAIAGGGTISSYGDNLVRDNAAAPAFTPPTLTRF